ncbi:MAG: DUF1801 domain-containing protein [Bacteroidetes bacterium]|nr:DUF1801 domain-containing protein [Bacteroidota bacterium]
MNIKTQIKSYLESQPKPKQEEMQILHRHIIQINPSCKIWFLDGKDEKGKIVSNPNIGYGSRTIKYADGKTKEFYQIGLSANSTGISVYIMGIEDKTFLSKTFGKNLGKASVTGYCIRFKKLIDINMDVLESVIRFGFENK